MRFAPPGAASVATSAIPPGPDRCGNPRKRRRRRGETRKNSNHCMKRDSAISDCMPIRMNARFRTNYLTRVN
ncbi:hypothetical protein Y048_6057 [Burkholderia pseudomallei MSHR456]|nr:hypothetical protein Y048_6057 [Burkholderia pseudomallei MSHR456]